MNKRHFNKNASKDSKLTVQFDHSDYMQYLDGMDVTDEQAKEMLMALWNIMVQFVDFGFDVNTGAERNSQSVAKLDSETPKTQNKKGHRS